MILKNKKNRIRIGILLFLSASLLFVLKALVTTDISTTDEAHYVSAAYRLYKGDAVLVDDWMPEQLNGVLLLPFVYLFRSFHRSSEGILLYFRYIYLLFKALLSGYAIYRLEKYTDHGIWGWVGVFLFYVATPYNIETLSYNTVPFMMVFMMGVMFLTSHGNKKDYLWCGLFLAAAILSQPFLLLIYVCGIVGVLFCQIGKKRGWLKKGSAVFDGTAFVWLTLGAGVLAVLFLMFVLSRARLSEVAENLMYIISEPDHNVVGESGGVGLFAKLSNTAHIFFYSHREIADLNLVGLGMELLFLLLAFRQDKQNVCERIAAVIPPACLVFSCLWQICLKKGFLANTIWIPFAWYVLEELLLRSLPVWRLRKQYLIFVFLGIYIIGVALGTNTGILSPAAAMSLLACFGMILFPKDLQNKFSEYIQIAVAGVLLFIMLYIRLFWGWDDFLQRDDVRYRISRGPLTGTYTSEMIHSYNEHICEDLDLAEPVQEDVLFCGSATPLAYLYADVRYGTMGTSFFELDYVRYKDYLRLHPDRVPTIVYFQKTEGTDEEKNYLESLTESYQQILTGDRILFRKSRLEQ